ncbi:uncharacterized protein YndB with AHSA1/START domain [Lewinella aquimaris]|uniref:Uncharacterized protein YndB with AHSA1/START domain n=1 Tax=Neolewinella aquimaris TaxID=1835722 RepID=A0A840EGR4_9BACT|nr:SRPBCC domain-containing protein [Neolewinella aquimaris]MBB4081078.1 uncharacterized protein YndB with AHSA1/START domain [Neolewinella aquimaris]
MATEQITVQTTVNASLHETWHYYTESEHVINWNFASEDWHCPAAVNDLRVGGDFRITMAAKDGSMSFDLEGTYDEVSPETHIAYTLSNGRKVSVDFSEGEGEGTGVVIDFDPEPGEDRDVQKQGWQSILDNFRQYAEAQSKGS